MPISTNSISLISSCCRPGLHHLRQGLPHLLFPSEILPPLFALKTIATWDFQTSKKKFVYIYIYIFFHSKDIFHLDRNGLTSSPVSFQIDANKIYLSLNIFKLDTLSMLFEYQHFLFMVLNFVADLIFSLIFSQDKFLKYLLTYFSFMSCVHSKFLSQNTIYSTPLRPLILVSTRILCNAEIWYISKYGCLFIYSSYIPKNNMFIFSISYDRSLFASSSIWECF